METKHTPETDAEAFSRDFICAEPNYGADKLVMADFARRLELDRDRLKAINAELVEALRGAQEELRLLRSKDTGAVYDPTLRVRISAALAKAGA